MGYRLAVDTGGTFTDIALINDQTGEIFVTKVPSSPEDPSTAILSGVDQLLSKEEILENEISFFIHGTTVATNALLEHKGAKTALITTKGFKDVLEIRRQNRPDLYSFQSRKPEPLIPRKLRVEITERINYLGEVEEDINIEEVKNTLNYLKGQNVESICVSFLNSYASNIHEKVVKELIEKEYPNSFISLSSEVLPEYKEYERTSTVAINSYVMPKMRRYLLNLETNLKKKNIKSDIYLMQSNGGVINIESATDVPAKTVLSGPAGGALAGSIISEMTGRPDLITIDMGGTSLDTCLIKNGSPYTTTMSEVGGYPIKLPMIEMHTIGAGGGSIAWVDTGGALRVGPNSAGAIPGPICYGKGGEEPTVTDANVVLGRLNPGYILGGKMKMDIENARRIIHKKIAEPLGLSVEEASEGILKVVNANMVRGVHKISTEKGHDPRDFSLVAFGGAGPLNAGDIAKELGSSEIIIPKHPGLNCSIGMLGADVKHDFVKTILQRTDNIVVEEIHNHFKGLQSKAMSQLTKEGFSTEQISVIRSLDLRFEDQAYEINILIDENTITNNSMEKAINKFFEEYKNLYGYKPDLEILELVNIRLTTIGHLKKNNNNFNNSTNNYKQTNIEPIEIRNVFFDGNYVKTKVYHRTSIKPTMSIQGPAVIEQLDSTIVIHPSQKVTCDNAENLIVNLN